MGGGGGVHVWHEVARVQFSFVFNFLFPTTNIFLSSFLKCFFLNVFSNVILQILKVWMVIDLYHRIHMSIRYVKLK